jgi:hypothetical protein
MTTILRLGGLVLRWNLCILGILDFSCMPAWKFWNLQAQTGVCWLTKSNPSHCLVVFVVQWLSALTRPLTYIPTGGVRTIPACNAVRRGFLHIVDFSLCAVIIRSAFAVFTPRGFKRFRKDLSKKIVKWWIFALCMERKLRFWVDTSFCVVHCVFTVCQNSL